ncbi:hypothetical protein [Candidatus Pantoea multigeneris]|uniref:Uncharacterized protein n=1 Tax=Candidatus Pantoea multigeneris TaxID=2608357 RepID=A0ABX0RKL9_9GAMM|nr:hypothetical protein [Pantoea multigeneris]NIF23890.1 hypothetical protein [Pantoea multigeneris]
MKGFLVAFLRENIPYLFVNVFVILVFGLSCLFFPECWFLCGLFSLVIIAVFDIFVLPSIKKRK